MSVETELAALSAAVITLNASTGGLTSSMSAAAASAATATTKANDATAQAVIASTKANEAAASAAAATVSAAYPDNTPVVKGSADATKLLRFEVDGFTTATTRVITPLNEDMTLVGVANVQTLINKTLTSPSVTNPTLIDSQLIRAMLVDVGLTVADKGNSGTATQTYDYTVGSVQTSTATGNHTLATSNWPPTGNLGQILIQLTNGGAFTLTWPTINWIKPDGTTTTSISTYLAALTGRTALQTSGMDQVLLWSRDAGTTIYGKIV